MTDEQNTHTHRKGQFQSGSRFSRTREGAGTQVPQTGGVPQTQRAPQRPQRPQPPSQRPVATGGSADSIDYNDPARYTGAQRSAREARSAARSVERKVQDGKELLDGLQASSHDQQVVQAQRRAQEYGSPAQVSYKRTWPSRDKDEEPTYREAKGATGPRRRPRRTGRGHHRALKVILALVIVLVAAYLAFFYPIDQKIAFGPSDQASLSEELTAPSTPLAPYYALLLGSDSRENGEPARTDTIILARIDPLKNQITLVSIPRDTKVDLAGYGTQKINAAYAFGGVAGATAAVKDLTGLPVSQVAIIDFNGLAQLIDAIGGITVDVPVAVNDPDYTGLVLPVGTQEMDGTTAMLFSRVRHGFDYGDYQRQADQQLVIQAIIDKVRSNPSLVPAAASSLGDVLSTSYHCYDLIPLLARMSVQAPTIYAASIPSTTTMIGGVSYVICDQSATQAMLCAVDAGQDPRTVTNGLQGSL